MNSKDEKNNAGGRGLNEIVKQISDKSYPPVHLWNPDHCGSINMRIKRDGTWVYMGTVIHRPEMVKLFSTVLRKDGDQYFLVTPVEKLSIEVDDVPFYVTHLQVFGEGTEQTLCFETLTNDKVIANKEHPLHIHSDPKTGAPLPYIHVRGGMDGLISRPIYYELVNLAQPKDNDARVLGVWSEGLFFELGCAE